MLQILSYQDKYLVLALFVDCYIFFLNSSCIKIKAIVSSKSNKLVVIFKTKMRKFLYIVISKILINYIICLEMWLWKWDFLNTCFARFRSKLSHLNKRMVGLKSHFRKMVGLKSHQKSKQKVSKPFRRCCFLNP